MRNWAYGIVIIAGALFIGDWGWKNYVAFQWAKNGVEQVSASVQADAGQLHFRSCQMQWPNSQIVRDSCDEQEVTGYGAFSRAWSDPNKTNQTGLALISCWQGNQGLGGTNWMLAGGCASVADPVIPQGN